MDIDISVQLINYQSHNMVTNVVNINSSQYVKDKRDTYIVGRERVNTDTATSQFAISNGLTNNETNTINVEMTHNHANMSDVSRFEETYMTI